MAHDVFISHSAKDKTTADAVCAMLESEGIRCWIAPRDVTPGMEWGECIIDAIEQARIMVLVFTADANASPQIRREVERAVNHGVAILPVRTEDVLPARALEYFIGNVHWLDALTPPLEAHLKNLASTVNLLVARMPAPKEQATHESLSHPAGAGKNAAPTHEPAPASEPTHLLTAVPPLEVATENHAAPQTPRTGKATSAEPSDESLTRRPGEWRAGSAANVARPRWRIPVWAWGVAAVSILALIVFSAIHKGSTRPTSSAPLQAPTPATPAITGSGAPLASPAPIPKQTPPSRPTTEPAKQLETVSISVHYEDIRVGTGPVGSPGKLWHIRYSGWLAANNVKFDSWDEHRPPVVGTDGKPELGPDGKPKLGAPQPLVFPQGVGKLIPGLDYGLTGMRIGGKRRIFIPWQLGYGAAGRPGHDAAHPGIPPKSDLIFDVELVDVTDMPPPATVSATPAGSSNSAPTAAPPQPQPKSY